MKKMIFVLIAMMGWTTTGFADIKQQGKTIQCETPYKEYKLNLDVNGVQLIPANRTGDRQISSLKKVRTLSSPRGHSKIFYYQQNQFKMTIKQMDQFSPIDDHLQIRSPEGHVITYPLECQSV
jgi:hypothetical protein